MRSFYTDMKRALTSWGFWTCVTGMVIALLIGAAGSIMNIGRPGNVILPGAYESFLENALSSDIVLLAVPILCAIVYTSSFVEDVASGYIKFYRLRSGTRQYIFARVVSTALSGGLALFVGIFAAYLVFYAVFTPFETMPVPENMAAPAAAPLAVFYGLLSHAVLFFLCGSLWALVGQLFASMTMSKYAAYASPFIFYYVLVIISERYMKDAYAWNPKYWLSTEGLIGGGIFGAVPLLAGIIAAAGLLFGVIAGRRLRNE